MVCGARVVSCVSVVVTGSVVVVMKPYMLLCGLYVACFGDFWSEWLNF